MNLTEHYDELYKASIKKIENDEYQTDLLIDSPNDKRFGITLMIRPPKKIKNNIQLFIQELKQLDSSQYYYPSSDIHITVLSIISCYEGFNLDRISIFEYSELIGSCIKEIDPLKINFKGVTASDSSIMIQGFPEYGKLNDLRSTVRTAFRNSELEQSIDKRYAIQTAHATVVRFRSKLRNKKGVLKIINDYKYFDFGTFDVEELELVFNDWYLRKKNTRILEKFEL